jgi:hypothetical protein
MDMAWDDIQGPNYRGPVFDSNQCPVSGFIQCELSAKLAPPPAVPH